MKKEDKIKIIEQIEETIKAYPSFYLVETAGLNAERTSELRRACFKAGVKLMVVKNKLLHKALENLEGDYSELYPALKESTSLMFTEVANAPAKLLKDFVKKDDVLPKLKGAYVEETVYMGADQLDTLATIRARTSSSPTLWLCCSRLRRMSSRPSHRVARSSMASSKLSLTKKTKHNQPIQ